MNNIISKLWLWIWHLLPANPILVRVVQGASRRSRHLWLRVVYLSALLGVVLISLFFFVSGQNASLTELAKGASQTFAWASITQLALMSFLAPVFTASAITQERDAQTFNILLSTPLSSAQIVFGSLMSRLYFVLVLLIAGLPIFFMTMVYGGVTASQIVESFALSGSTAILTGALAIFVAMTAVGTRGTIFSFYLVIGLYLLSVYLFGQWDRTWIEASAANIDGGKMSWLTPLHPFLSLDVALNRLNAPPESRLMDRSSIIRFALAHPSAAYVAWTTTLAFILTSISILFVRRGAKTGEMTFWISLKDRFRRQKSGELTRPPRTVWANPVAWREAKTRASSSGGIIRWVTILGGLIASMTLFYLFTTGELSANTTTKWLASLTIVQFAIALIIAANTAATAMTKEREAQTMDILLTTPLTSRYILWGKLRGLVSFAAPLLAIPVSMLLIFGIYGLWKGDTVPAVWLETSLVLGVLLTLYTALACLLGLRISLTSKSNVAAVMYSIGLLTLLCGLLTALLFAFVQSAGDEFGAFLAPFSPFSSIWYGVDRVDLFDTQQDYLSGASSARYLTLVGTTFALTSWGLFAWRSYLGLVRDFDMTMRKKSGT